MRGGRRPNCPFKPINCQPRKLCQPSVGTYTIHSQDTQCLCDQGDDRVDGLEKESLFVAETDSGKDIGSVVLNDGYTGHLNGELEDDTQEYSAQVGRDAEDLRRAVKRRWPI